MTAWGGALRGVLATAGAMAALALAGLAEAAPRFEVTLDPSVSKTPMTGRLFVVAATRETPEPRLTVGLAGPGRAHQLELRASWTATTPELGTHVQAFCEVLEHAAGLPPVGITDLSSRTRV